MIHMNLTDDGINRFEGYGAHLKMKGLFSKDERNCPRLS